jgi:hypothetical protein
MSEQKFIKAHTNGNEIFMTLSKSYTHIRFYGCRLIRITITLLQFFMLSDILDDLIINLTQFLINLFVFHSQFVTTACRW